jgi:hypothetical protein
LVPQGGRGHAAGDKSEASAAVSRPQVRFLEESGKKGIPRICESPVKHGLGAVRIVELKNGGLHEKIGRSETGRMAGIPLNFGWAPLMALDQHAAGIAAEDV